MYSLLWWVVVAVDRADHRELVIEPVRVIQNYDAGMRGVDVPCLRRFPELLQALVHHVERAADGDGGNGDADEEGEALLDGRSADQISLSSNPARCRLPRLRRCRPRRRW
jgi:hypothetical protein